MPDLSMEMPCAALDEAFAGVVDREGKIPAAIHVSPEVAHGGPQLREAAAQ